MAKEKVLTDLRTEDTESVVADKGLDIGTATLEAVSIAEYDRARDWSRFVAGALAGRSTDGPSALQYALQFADQALAERDRRFPVEHQS